ncbi:hypothetical protein L7F22_035799 [Adiantum nelumboides]|nr:hypothetical protein [Adiantum nelumboides]
MVEDTGTNSVIPLLTVSSKILSKLIEYCRYHALWVPKNGEDKPTLTSEEVKHWDADFLKVDQSTLFDLILAANYLNIQSPLDCAHMIKGSKFAAEDCDETYFKQFCKKGQKSLEAMADWEEEKWSAKLKKEFMNACKGVWHLQSMVVAFMMSHQVEFLPLEADLQMSLKASGLAMTLSTGMHNVV